jgi:hypothetical protein
MLVPELFREIERERGHSLTEIGTAGVAFTREDALRALECLKGSQAGVLGGDVLKITNGKLRYTHDGWHSDRKQEEDIVNFLRRSITETEKYIQSYPDPGDGTVLYSLVVSELGLGATQIRRS